MIVTEWFEAIRKPVRIGVYERYDPFMPGLMPYSYWDGRQWGFSRSTPYVAKMDRLLKSKYQNVRWRGIVKE